MNTIKLITALILIYLMFNGSNCSEVVNNPPVTQDITGTWKLNFSQGSLNDICPGENVNFQSNGIAILTCPNRPPINRNYSVSGNTLTYTETNVKYTIQLSNNNSFLTLTGINNNRILTYSKVISSTEAGPEINSYSTAAKNSSETIK
jgi:hypothetical protein